MKNDAQIIRKQLMDFLLERQEEERMTTRMKKTRMKKRTKR